MSLSNSQVKTEDGHDKRIEDPVKNTTTNNSILISIRNIVTKLLVSPLLVLFICVALIPFLFLISAFAGWLVWKNVPSGWHAPIFLQYGDRQSPYADLELPSMVVGRPYDISLHLVIPETHANYELGNFMTSLTLKSFNNETLAYIRRPYLILPSSPSLLTKVFKSSPRLLSIRLPLLTSFVAVVPQIIAHIQIGRQDDWRSLGKGEGRELSVLSAVIYANTHPSGLLTRLFSKYPITMAAVSSIIFFAISLLIISAFMVRSVQLRSTDVVKYDSVPKTEDSDIIPETSVTLSHQPDAPVPSSSEDDSHSLRQRLRTLSETLRDNNT